MVVIGKRLIVAAVSAVLLTLATMMTAVSGTAGAAPTGWRYIMVAFSNDTDRTMDVYQSSDGTTFTLLKRSAYTPPSGRVRDPSIVRSADGFYYITYTTGNPANIGFARSRDLLSWAPVGNYPVPLCCALLPGTGDGKGLGSSSGPGSSGSAGSSDGPSLSPFTTKAWAPEFFADGPQVSVILSMSTGGGFVPYVMSALGPSMRLWTPPVPIAGLGADHIDTQVVKYGGVYHAFTKNETKKFIQHAVAPSLAGPYRFVTPGNWGTYVEGPTVIQLPNGAWRMYFDAYTRGKYLYSDSGDGMRTWTAPTELPGLSGTIRHVGVMRERA